jgi:hypothetical protein
MSETTEIDTREPGEKKRNNVASAGLPPDLWRDLEEYREENEIPKRSDAVQRLLTEALADDEAERREPVAYISGVFGLLYIAIYQWGNPSSLDMILGIYLVVMLWWSLAPVFRDLTDEYL